MPTINLSSMKKFGKKTIPLRYLFLSIFIVLVTGMTAIIINIIFSNWMSAAEKTAIQNNTDLNKKILQEVDIFISNPLENNFHNKEFIENGLIDLSNQAEREKFFVLVLQNLEKEIYSFSYGTSAGEYYGARRNEKNIIEIMRNDETTLGYSRYYSVKNDLSAGDLVLQTEKKFDPRTRDWYKIAAESGGPAFSPVYKHFVMDDMTVSAAYPLYDDTGALQGVLGTHIILSNINQYLSQILSETTGFALIVEEDTGYLIANSLGLENFSIAEDGRLERNTIQAMNHAAILQAYNLYLANGDNNQKLVHEDGEQLFITLTDYHQNGLNWLLITAIPESVFFHGITENITLTIVLIILSVILFSFTYIWLTSWYLKPINGLIEATQKFSKGDFSSRIEILRDDEVGRISKSMNVMADTITTLVSGLEEKVEERTIELETANSVLKENKDQLQLLLDSTAEGIYGVDNDGYCTFCNTSSLKLLGFKDQDQILGKNIHWLIHYKKKDGSVFPIEECKISKAFKEGKRMHSDNEVFWRADGVPFDAEYHSYPQFKDGEIVGAVVTFMDITEGKKATEKIKYLSDHDTLTGLYNRPFFEDALKKIDVEENIPISIIFGDVNGLKLANDVFGHAAGDELLQKTARILKNVCREDDIIARIGGDEFTIILPRTDARASRKIIDRVNAQMEKEEIEAIKCSMALGASTKTEPEQLLSEILGNAENEMYKSKTINRKTINSDLLDNIIFQLHKRSPSEKSHSESVSRICEEFGLALKLPDTEVAKLKEAGYYHDIGKIVLDNRVLKKKQPLKDEEKWKIQQHPVVGFRIINLFDDKLDLAEGIFCHHEKWDGSGYPKGLRGNDIPELARILSIVEFYVTFTTCIYPGKKQEALEEIMRESGKKFDPKFAQTFVNMVTSGSVDISG